MNVTKQILNYIIKEKAQGNSFQELNVQMKIMMKGINVKGIMEETIPAENVEMVAGRLKEVAAEFGVDLKKMPPAPANAA